MPKPALHFPSRSRSHRTQPRRTTSACTDQVVGNILSGWRYDISALSPDMRTDYDQHLVECAHCRRRQRVARTIDVLLITVSTLSIAAFLLAAVVIRRLEAITRLARIHVALHHAAVAISLEAVAVAGLVVSLLLWVLVAVATPLPGLVGSLVQRRLPVQAMEAVRDRFTRHAA